MAEQFLALAFQHLVHRNAGPARNHLGDMRVGHGLFHQPVAGGFFGRLQLLLQAGMRE
jgi:hypothetical protein